MKKLIWIFALIAMAFSFAACSDDDKKSEDNGNNGGNSGKTEKVKVEGTGFSGGSATGEAASDEEKESLNEAVAVFCNYLVNCQGYTMASCLASNDVSDVPKSCVETDIAWLKCFGELQCSDDISKCKSIDNEASSKGCIGKASYEKEQKVEDPDGDDDDDHNGGVDHEGGDDGGFGGDDDGGFGGDDGGFGGDDDGGFSGDDDGGFGGDDE